MKLNQFLLLSFCFMTIPTYAQYAWQDNENVEKEKLGKGINYKIETQVSFSNNQTPLWLNANKFGLSSLEKNNGYMRASAIRPLSNDSARRWGFGYGLDIAVPVKYTSNVIIQQAFAEVRWLNGVLSIGSKEYPMELKNNILSSGSQALGINARPVPQVRIALPNYWTIPALGRWFHLKGHIAYGKFTDDSWQEDFTNKTDYTTDALYHSKAGYLKIGSEERFCPWSFEIGLEMASQFGGTKHILQSDGTYVESTAPTGIKDYWHAFLPGGQDASDGEYGNIEGNQLGSWVMRLNYENDVWAFHLYGDHYFEDHSQMLFVDYDGYGSGDEWNEKKDRRFFVYSLKDMMLGTELNFKFGRWFRDFVFEYIYTKYQSGPYNHDHTSNISDHVAGVDDYYNHGFYHSWQHWGQVMGNPLYRSPLYNSDGTICVEDNRFMAFHFGMSGQPYENIKYRILATYQEGFGRYADPYTKKRHNVSFLAEIGWSLKKNWNVKGAYAMDFGSILGHNAGFQLTISKSGIFNLGK